MVTIAITIPDEIKEKLKNIDNKSKLIANLLSQYFEQEFDSLEVLKARKNTLEKDHVNQMIRLNQKIQAKEEELIKEEQRQQRIEHINKLREQCRNEDEIEI
jgi:predicted CopG family antitoxin